MTGNDQTTETPALTPKQDLLIMALLTPLSIAAAAQAAGIGEKTARRWLKLPHFQQAYRNAQKLLFDQALTGLMAGLDEAIDGIKNIAKDGDTLANVRLRAYQIWLEQAISVHKTSELEDKLNELEQLIKQQGILR